MLAELLSNIVESVVFVAFIEKTLKLKRNGVVHIVGFLTAAFLLVLNISFFDFIAFHNIFTIIIDFLILAAYAGLFLCGDILTVLSLVMIYHIALGGIASFSAVAVAFITELPVWHMKTAGEVFRFYGLIVSKCLLVIAIPFFIRYMKKCRLDLYSRREKYVLAMVSLAVYCIMSISLVLFERLAVLDGIGGLQMLLQAGIFLLFIIILWLFQFMVRSERQKEQSRRQKEFIIEQKRQYQEEIRFNDRLKKYLHDRKNVLLGILSYFDQGEIEHGIEMLRKEVDESEGLRGKYAGSSVIEGFIERKLEAAQAKGIRTKKNIVIGKAEEFCDPMDLCIVLGNLLDNAVEAVEGQDSESRWMELSVVCDIGVLLVMTVNPLHQADIGSKHREKGKKNPEFHGVGLFNVKQIISQYGGTMDIQENDGRFTVRAAFPQRMK